MPIVRFLRVFCRFNGDKDKAIALLEPPRTIRDTRGCEDNFDPDLQRKAATASVTINP
jgi:hypothetical protein